MKIGNKDKVEKLVIFSIATIMCLSILMFLPTANAYNYQQLPNPNGWDVFANMPNNILADDFLCTETGPITHIHFWGSWNNDIMPPGGKPLGFHISFHADIPDPDGTGPLYSMPGTLLWSRDISVFNCTPVTPSLQGWFEPPSYFQPGNHMQYFRYDIDFTEPYFQQTDGTIYWLDIAPITQPGFFWGWKTSMVHFNDDAVYTIPATPPQTLLSENFDAYIPAYVPFPPTGWSVVQGPCYPTNAITITTEQYHSGARSLRFSSMSSCGSGYNEYLISPLLTTTSGDQTVSFWYRRYSSGTETFRVGWSSTGNNVATDFTWSADITGATTTWQQYTKTDLPVGTTYVAIHYKSSYQYYLYIDDFSLPGTITQGFEGTPASGWPPSGWTTQVVSGTDTDNFWRINSTSPQAPPHSAKYMAEYPVLIISSANSARLYTPALAFSGTGHSLSFWMYHDSDYSTYNDKVVIQVSTNGLTWTDLTQFLTYSPTVGWANHVVSLSAYDGSPTIYVGFLGVSYYGYNNVMIDDVQITNAGSPGGWGELRDPITHTSLDLAFNITGSSGCTPICKRTRDNVQFCTIQQAIDDANTINGDTIEVYPGTYTENAHNWVDIDVYKELTIKGQAGSGGTIIELNERNNPAGAHMDGVSISASNVKIQGFTFTKKPTAPYASGFNIRAGINVHTPPPANTFTNITLQDVVSEYSYGSNVIFDGAYTYNNIKINDCNIHHSYTERCFYQSPNTIINGFTITNSHFDYAGYGIPTSGDPIGFNLQGTTTNLQITGGTFNENPNGGIGIRRTTNAVISGVSVVHSGYHSSGTRSGIGIWEDMSITSNVQIINPTITNSGGRGLMFGTWGKTVQDITVTGGTISGSGNIGCMLYTGGAGGLVQRIKYTGLTVTNSLSHNLLFQEDDSSGASTCRYVNVTQCTITNSPGKGVYYYGMNVAGSLVNYNNIDNNVDGVFNSAGIGTLDATCNWWGDISGPSGVASGSGDTVSTNVIYCPWLNAAYPLGTCTGGTVCWNTRTGEYFCTIQKAIDDSDTIDGDTIEVFAGTHPGNIIVYKELTIKSQSGAAVTIINASKVDYSGYKNAWGYGINYAWAQTNDPGLLKNGFMIWKDDVTIDGFKIINALWPTQYNRGIGILIGSIHTTYAGFIPWNIDQWGGLISPVNEPKPTRVVIKNNIIDGASDGIYNWASNGNTFEYNTVMNSVAVGGVGIQCYEGGTNNIIRGNTIDNVDGSGISICGAWPNILLDVSNTQIYDNTIKNSNWGIQYYNIAGSNVDAYNNNILDNNKGVVVEGVGGALVGHANYNNIVGNTIGIENTAPDGVFDAECNWYGHALGPTNPSNPGGIGDTVTNNVDYLPWLNLPFENPNTLCGGGQCKDPVYVDDSYTTSTLGYGIDHFPLLQWALDRVCPGGTVYVYPGNYGEGIDYYNAWIDGITIIGMNIPLTFDVLPGNSAIIGLPLHITGDDITVNYLVFNPSTTGAVIVSGDNVVVQYNKFLRDCLSGNPIGIENQGQNNLDARYNWWGRPDGPSGNTLDANTGRIADGLGAKIVDNGPVLFDPWAGIDAVADASATVVETGESILFNSADSFATHFDGTENEFDVLWDFGDGILSFEKQIAHVYDSPGTYDVSLRLMTSDPELWGAFMFDWDYLTITVTTPGAPLAANADGSNLEGYETTVDEQIQLYGLAVGGTQPYTYNWDLGDSKTSDMQNPTHIYNKAGTYTATLTVTDNIGAIATDTTQITVHEIGELIVKISGDRDTLTGIETLFTAIVSGGKTPYTFSWSFGDGITSTSQNPTHIYEQTGTYTITLTVTDDDNNIVSDSATMKVSEGIDSAEIKQVSGGFRITATIAAGDTDCDWTINVNANFLLSGGEAIGTIESNTQETVKLPLTFAFGKAQITVTANEIQKQYTAFALGPLFLNVQEI